MSWALELLARLEGHTTESVWMEEAQFLKLGNNILLYSDRLDFIHVYYNIFSCQNLSTSSIIFMGNF